MVVIFYGTSAELIKLIGLVKSIDRDQMLLICTAQQKKQIEQFHEQINIYPDIYLAQGWRGRDVHSIVEMAGFMIKAHTSFIFKYRTIRKIIKSSNLTHKNNSVGIVHGDTLTTVVGSYFSALLGLKLAHVEAGLRSGHLFHPFPEEIDRRIVSKIARIHYSPNKVAINNLLHENTKGTIIETKYNTSIDAMKIAINHKSGILERLNIPRKYGLVSIHRTELLERKKELEDFLITINQFADSDNNLVFLDHATTKDKLTVLGLDGYLNKKGIYRIPKLAYMDFIQVVKKADYILTDSGGLQEDAYFLGIPTMIHRLATERSEGLGENIQLSGLKIKEVNNFLASNKKTYKNKLGTIKSPSKIILDDLKFRGYVN